VASVALSATRAESMLKAGSSHGKSCAGVLEQNEQFGKDKVLFMHGRLDNPQFLPCRPNFSSSIFVDQANLTAEIIGNTLQ
jgi:hypothetical protein